VVVECDRRRRVAGEDAARLVADAEQRAQAITARARASVEAERADAAIRLQQTSAMELEALSQQARIAAERIRRESTRRNGGLAAHVVEVARTHLQETVHIGL
jgi:hypothetical protein